MSSQTPARSASRPGPGAAQAAFTGQPEHVINYFFFVAEEVREIMAALGYKKFDEMVGQTQMLDQSKLVAHWKAKGSTSRSCSCGRRKKGQKIYHAETQNHHLEKVLDRRLIDKAQAALDRGAPVKIDERSTTPTAPRARCSPARWPDLRP